MGMIGIEFWLRFRLFRPTLRLLDVPHVHVLGRADKPASELLCGHALEVASARTGPHPASELHARPSLRAGRWLLAVRSWTKGGGRRVRVAQLPKNVSGYRQPEAPTIRARPTGARDAGRSWRARGRRRQSRRRRVSPQQRRRERSLISVKGLFPGSKRSSLPMRAA
jgi:hypothetical protein